MKYRSSWFEFWKEKLDVPKDIERAIYNKNLTIEEYVKYDLCGKIPESCLSKEDRQLLRKLSLEGIYSYHLSNHGVSLAQFVALDLIYKLPLECLSEEDKKVVEKFGIERLRELDKEIFKSSKTRDLNFSEMFSRIDTSTEDINRALYEILVSEIPPSYYSFGMKNMYPGIVIDDYESLTEYEKDSIEEYKYGNLSLKKAILNWHLFKDVNISFCLKNNYSNNFYITDEQVKMAMSKCGDAIQLISSVAPCYSMSFNVYSFIAQIVDKNQTEEEQKKYVREILGEVLKKSINRLSELELTASDYQVIFKYITLAEALENNVSWANTNNICAELKNLPSEFIEELPFPIKLLFNDYAMFFINTYGLKNIVDFDNECGHFFTANNCEMLLLTFDLYLHYAGCIYDTDKTFNTKKVYDKNGNYNTGPYTKDEFYELIRRMILYGPTGSNLNEVPDKLSDSRIIKYTTNRGGTYYTIDYRDITGEFRTKNPDLFISDDASIELQDLFYSKAITPRILQEHPEYISYLKGKRVESYFKKISVSVYKNQNDYFGYKNLYLTLIENVGFEETMRFITLYSEIFEDVLANSEYYEKCRFNLDLIAISSEKSDGIQHAIEDAYYEKFHNRIITEGLSYNPDKLPLSFKEKYPTMFLNEDVPKDIKDKFYNREFTVEDFINNPDLIKIFGQTNIVFGFSQNLCWFSNLFDDLVGVEANSRRLKIIAEYLKINDATLQEIFREYVLENKDNLNMDTIEKVSEVLLRLSYSNSIEMSSFKKSFANLLLNTSDPVANIETIEKIFLRNNLPLCGKMFLCFKTLYPDFSKTEKFSFVDSSRLAPELKNVTLPKILFHASEDEIRYGIIFNDLFRIAYRSGERSLIEYINNIEIGNDIFLKIQNNECNLDGLSPYEKTTLEIFVSHLEVLYQNTKRYNNEEFTNLPLEGKVKIYGEIFKGTSRYDLKDIIVRTFCYFAGVKSFDELKQLIIDARKDQVERMQINLDEIQRNGGIFKFEKGDFVRGIGSYKSFGSTLSSGNFSKEHLGMFTATSDSDTTPLDVDLTLITKTEDIYHAIEGTPTGFGFGNIYIILKKDNPSLNITRDKDGNLTGAEYDPKKIEVFGTSIAGTVGYETHWGARTGLAFTDVDFILYKKDMIIDSVKPYDENGNVNYVKNSNSYEDDGKSLSVIKFEIARNGYYIPVIDFSGRVIFTEQEFYDLRKKMAGLSYFGETTYCVSTNINTIEVEEIIGQLDDGVIATIEKRNRINALMSEAFAEMGLQLKTAMDGDLTEGFAELIDTGSTGRGTNEPGKGDFDFMLRLDRTIFNETEKLEQFKAILLKHLGKTIQEIIITDNGDYRIKNVDIGDEIVVDMDISFTQRTDKVTYSTDMALQDRLDTIKRTNPEIYPYVVANIILAKRVLKEAEVYKPCRGEIPQGGLGGVGIENWILQNGGSFFDAAVSFITAAEGKTFEEFSKTYQIWDFGENYMADRKGKYLHDEFVSGNMDENGYKKMIVALQEYVKKQKESYGSKK